MLRNSKLFFPPAVTVDVVIFTIEDDELKVLLVKRNKAPFAGYWALPGGFVLKNETTAEAARRILKEKTGVASVFMEQLYTFDSPTRDPRGHILTVAYFALVEKSKIKFDEGADLQTPAFHMVRKLPKLAFDHRVIIEYALRRASYKLEYTNAVLAFLPRKFTFAQLQAAYEAVWGKKLDKRNFRKKFLALKLVKPAGKKISGTRQRPAGLFRFASQKSIELKRFF